MAYLWITSILWAFSFGLIKGQLTGIDSNFVTFTRLAISFLIFLPFIRRKDLPARQVGYLCGIGAVQFGLMYLAYIAAFHFLQAYEVALFTIFTPIYVSIYHQARQGRWSTFSLMMALLAVIGTAIVEVDRALQQGFWLGFIIVQISNICFAIGQVEYRFIMYKLQKPDQQVMGWLYLGGMITATAAVVIFTDFSVLEITGRQWGVLVYLGAIASGVGFFLWNKGARIVHPGALAIFNNLKIPLAVAVSLLFFGERTNWVTLLVGGGIVLAALWIHERHESGTGKPPKPDVQVGEPTKLS